MLKEIFQCLVELVYPSNIYCIICGNIIDGTRVYSLCDSCVRTVHWNNSKVCGKCGKILREGYDQPLCVDCMTIEHSFEQGFACVEYGKAERDLIHNFKYKDRAYLGRKMSEIMHDRIIIENLEVDLIIPVPMYRKKQRKRGYNQAAILAKCLSQSLEMTYCKNVLVREIETEAMSGLGEKERRENIKNAFTVKEKWGTMIQGKSILLVDDIYTTGSTVDACSDALLEAGAEKVYVFAFAAGANIY